MDDRQLEVFRMIAEELHFGRAAQRLFVAQASVSQQLQKLEAEVGVRLVHRNSRTVRLTPAGTVFLSAIEHISAASDRAVQLARAAAAGKAGVLRIATNYPASRLLLLPALERLRARDPGLTSRLREIGSPDQVRALLRGDLDIGLVFGPIDGTGLDSRHLLDVPVVATVRPGHPLAEAEILPLSEIPRFPYLTGFAGGSAMIQAALLRTAAEQGVHLGRAANPTDLSSYPLELETTDTIGFSSLPRAEQGRANGLRLLRLGPREPMLEIHVAWDPRNDEPLVNTVIQQLCRLADGLRERA